MKQTQIFLMLLVLLAPISAFAQNAPSTHTPHDTKTHHANTKPKVQKNYLQGTVLDAETGEPLVGATIYDPVKKGGATTDLMGKFKLAAEDGTEVTISYIGYIGQKVTITSGNDEVIELKPNTVMMRGVSVMADAAIGRKTPVAYSTISPLVIEDRLGIQEFPEILKSTPGIYATRQGGGYGDSRVNLRGFEPANVAVMVNGVPVNDMEWGGVYWSNWSGLSDVTSSIQVQRGLGASKVSSPSVGGSINVMTKSTDAERLTTAFYGIGSDGSHKISFSHSTGLMSNGWAVTLLGAKNWSSSGYILGTEFSGYSYFANVSKRINNNHLISLTGFGAPQWHSQRYNGDKLLIGEYEKYKEGYRYNASYGFDDQGVRHNSYYNHFHKPQISLNHYWDIDDKSSLSTVAYVSIGRGGGYGGRGNNRSDLYGTSSGLVTTKYRTLDNYFDFGAIMAENAANPNGSQAVIATSTNEHNWYGLISTYNTKVGKGFDISAGIDARYYEGIHQARIVDLLGGAFFIDPDRASKNNRGAERNTFAYLNEKLKVGDIVYRDNTGYVVQVGGFAQGEYSNKYINAFVSGSISNNSYWKIDRFYYDNERSKTMNFLGFTVKGGVNYNINSMFNVFGNIGYISRAPFMSGGVFTSIHTSNGMNPDPVNEKIFSKELGAAFRSRYVTVNLNLYHTNWNDKAITRSVDASNPDAGTVNLKGVNALHQGIELEIVSKPFKNFELKGMLSLGDWKWTKNAEGYAYNRDGQPVDERGDVVEEGSPKHAKVVVNMKGVHVGNSAQWTGSLGASYSFLRGFKVGLDWQYYSHNYSYFSIANNFGENTMIDPWRIPDASVFDLFLSYRFNVGPCKFTITGNVNNLFDAAYVLDANDGASHTWETAQVIYAFGRTMSLSLKVAF
ncbi:MAG: TonB-dependent receptor [Bacteroidales bacterium]|nr:TonB-dependent receptor [Bacteroidales bacterium]